MKEASQSYLKRAAKDIETAEHLLELPDIAVAATRAYYAMFYTVEALLHEMGLSFSKHSGAHAAFGQHFAKTAVLDPKFHRWLLAAFYNRLLADYDMGATLRGEQVEEMIAHAREFLAAASRHLEEKP